MHQLNWLLDALAMYSEMLDIYDWLLHHFPDPILLYIVC